METLMRLHSSTRPFVSGIQKEIARHWNNETQQEQETIVEIKDDSAIGQLPLEIRHTVCSYLSSVDLAKLSQVSYAWNLMCEEDHHWKSAYDAEKSKWDSIQCYKPSATMWDKLTQASSNVTDLWAEEENTPAQKQTTPPLPKWKATLILNRLNHLEKEKKDKMSKENESTSSPPLSPSIGLRSNIGEVAQAIKTNAPVLASKLASKMGQIKVPFKKLYRVPMLGEGLESTSKDLLYSVMWPQNSPMFNVTGLYPGTEGIGSGVGFSVNNVNMNIAALHRCDLDDKRVKWRAYFQKSDAVIYVVSCKNLPKKPVRKQLKAIVSGEDPLVPSKAPLLVLLVSDDNGVSSIRPSEIAEDLGLEQLERAWCIQSVDMSSLKGMGEGLIWLSGKL